MFAYNTLSDLITGELVTPIKKDGGKIICLNSKNEEVEYSFEDFDFDKTVEERVFIVEDSSDDEPIQEEPIEKEEDISSSNNHWITDNGDKYNILKSTNYTYKSLNNVNIWQDVSDTGYF